MLTQEQTLKIAEAHGMSYGVTILPDSPLFNNSKCLVDFANACYAAGEAAMRERCAKVCTDLESVYLHRWISNLTPELKAKQESAEACVKAIRALKETP